VRGLPFTQEHQPIHLAERVSVFTVGDFRVRETRVKFTIRQPGEERLKVVADLLSFDVG